MLITQSEKRDRLLHLAGQLSDKHRKVTDEILSGKDKVEAYRHVYHTASKTDAVRRSVSRLLKRVEVSDYISLHRELAAMSVAEQLGIDERYILSGLKRIADDENAKDGDRRLSLIDLAKATTSLYDEKVLLDVYDPLRDILNRITERNRNRSPLPSGK